jgi:hypothetical protein
MMVKMAWHNELHPKSEYNSWGVILLEIGNKNLIRSLSCYNNKVVFIMTYKSLLLYTNKEDHIE